MNVPVGSPRAAWLVDWAVGWRNRLLRDPRFQRWAARFPLTRAFARRRARALFDLSAGFVYSQVLQASVQLGLLEALGDGPLSQAELSARLGLSDEATRRLLDAAAALDLVERHGDGRSHLGVHGAALLGNPGARAMIAHHALLYRDLLDPVALLKGTAGPTALRRFWAYGQSEEDADRAGEAHPTPDGAPARWAAATNGPSARSQRDGAGPPTPVRGSSPPTNRASASAQADRTLGTLRAGRRLEPAPDEVATNGSSAPVDSDRLLAGHRLESVPREKATNGPAASDRQLHNAPHEGTTNGALAPGDSQLPIARGASAQSETAATGTSALNGSDQRPANALPQREMTETATSALNSSDQRPANVLPQREMTETATSALNSFDQRPANALPQREMTETATSALNGSDQRLASALPRRDLITPAPCETSVPIDANQAPPTAHNPLGDPLEATAAEPLGAQAAGYSQLMAASLDLLAEDVLEAYPFARHRRLLDVAGGEGAFLERLAPHAPRLELALFDLPGVAMRARARLARAGLADRATVTGGDFFRDPLPTGADVVTLLRVVHDHDDAQALRLLRAVRQALPPKGTVILAEPMSDTAGARGMGDAYFGFYLLAMGQGRPRSITQLSEMLQEVGFRRPTPVPTRRPLFCRLLIATTPP